MLIVVTASAVWLAKTSNRVRKQAAAVKALEQNEAIVQFDESVRAPKWLRNAVGEEYFRSAKSVDFATNRGRKSGTKESKANDETLQYLTSLGHVEELELGNNEDVTDDGLAHLISLKDLSTLYLYRTGVRGPGLEHISQLPKLTSISFSRSPLDDSGLVHLGSMSRLAWARLDYTNVTDAGMVNLKGATALETLSLRRTVITDEGLRHLEGLKHLKSLDMTGTNVTLNGVQRFKKAVPKCNVTVTFGLGVEPNDELLFPPNHVPTATEINARLKELEINGEVKTDTSIPGSPIVSLRLWGCNLSDKSLLTLLEAMPELQQLNLRRGLVGDEFIAGIGGKRIRTLSLRGTRVTDAGLKHLAKLPNLMALYLDETDITDKGLACLHEIKTLSDVSFDDTRTTRDGESKLREALPNW
ncbi:MAG: hypothetical protein KDA87_22185, partial [Planctomycetales bacterium]|nr:hypothetical protein [Planctomycetales bacterium]